MIARICNKVGCSVEEAAQHNGTRLTVCKLECSEFILPIHVFELVAALWCRCMYGVQIGCPIIALLCFAY